jgi:hypothetical protein
MHQNHIDSHPTGFVPLYVTYRATGSLKPDPRNARTHSKRQVEQIVASIREFGFANPILRAEESVVIAGHGRLLAAIEPWLVEEALSRLDRRLSPQEQGKVISATRTPHKVRWPEWWKVKP